MKRKSKTVYVVSEHLLGDPTVVGIYSTKKRAVEHRGTRDTGRWVSEHTLNVPSTGKIIA